MLMYKCNINDVVNISSNLPILIHKIAFLLHTLINRYTIIPVALIKSFST